MTYLTNREAAWFLTYIGFVFYYYLTNSRIKSSFQELCNFRTIGVLLCSFVYFGLFLHILFRLSLWELKFFKETIFWLLFCIFVVIHSDNFKKMLLNNFLGSIIIGFLCHKTNFSFSYELLLALFCLYLIIEERLYSDSDNMIIFSGFFFIAIFIRVFYNLTTPDVFSPREVYLPFLLLFGFTPMIIGMKWFVKLNVVIENQNV